MASGSGKAVYCTNFFARSFATGSEDLVGLPPIAGHQLRQIVTALQAPDLIGGSTAVINDCRPNKPALFAGKNGSEHYSVVVEQDVALRTLRFKVGGAGMKNLFSGSDMHVGDANGQMLGSFARRRINVGPGMAVVPVGSDFELRANSTLLTRGHVQNDS